MAPVVTTHAEIGFALTAVFGVAIATASPGLKPSAKPVPIERPFAVAWNDVAQDAAKKTDKVIRVIPLTVSEKTVLTERILIPPAPDVPVSVPSVAVALEDKPVVQRRRHVARRDVCARHGMKKVYRGKRWNCRK